MELDLEMAIVPIVIGLVEVIKKFDVDDKFYPVIALLLGVALTIFVRGGANQESIVLGIIYGLSASGLYSNSKSGIEIISGLSKEKDEE